MALILTDIDVVGETHTLKQGFAHINSNNTEIQNAYNNHTGGAADKHTLSDIDLATGSLGASKAETANIDATMKLNNSVNFDAEVIITSAAAVNIDWTDGNKQKVTLGHDITFTFLTAPNGPCNVQIRLIQDPATPRTVTWPATVKWPSGDAHVMTTTVNSIDIVAFYYDGSTYYGLASQNFS